MKSLERNTLALTAAVGLAAPWAPAGAAQESRLVEEIVVTAQKREQRLLDVPIAVAAFSGLELEERGIASIQDLALAVPGVTTREDGPGSYQVFMRGLANQYGPGALVGVYLDEAPMTVTGYDQLDVRVMDLERVEVLKGPQGTLYGQGSMAGAVRYITRDPVLDRLEGSLEGELTSVSHGDTGTALEGVLNLPVVQDVFALRLAAQWQDGGGWIDQPEAGIEDGNGPELTNLRLKALWEVTPAFTAEGMLIRHRMDTELGLGYEEPDRTNLVGIDRSRELLPKEYDYDLYNLDLSFDLGFAELLSATTYIDHEHQYPFSYIGGEDTIYGGGGFLEGVDDRWVEADQISQELRLTSLGGGPLTWTVGAFYRDSERALTAHYDTLFGGVVFPSAMYFSENTYEEYSIYADVAYQLTERLQVGVGARYFEDDQTNSDGTTEESDSFDSVDPRVYASFRVSDDVNVYASVSQGFRSGGFNLGELPNYGPEELTTYELGVKSRLAGGALDAELAGYYSEYDGMIRRGLVFIEELAQFQSLLSNIGEVETQGVEAALTWRPVEGLSLSGTVSYIDSEIVKVDADDATNIEGDPVDYVPEWSYTLGARYDFAWSDRLPGYVRVDYSYRDEVSYVDRSSFPAENLPQYSDDLALLDARIGLTWDLLSFELFGTNITDENDYIDPYHAWANANRTRPRVVGLNVRYAFE